MFNLIIFGVGAFLVLSTIFQKEKRKKDLKYASITTGKVIDYKTKWQRKAPIYLPEITFQTEQNEKITFVEEEGSSFKDYEIGDEVDVYYDADNPSSAGIMKYAGYDSMSVIVILLGIGIMIFGMLYR